MLNDSDMYTNSKSTTIVINELLCYVSCKFGKLSNAILTDVLRDYYTADDISKAKKTLVKAIESVNIESWITPRNRIQNDDKPRKKLRIFLIRMLRG